MEHKSSPCNFNKHFIQGLKKVKKKERKAFGQSRQKNVLWHSRIKETIVIALGIYGTFKILDESSQVFEINKGLLRPQKRRSALKKMHKEQIYSPSK